jgi:hypothetical protein
MQRICEQCGATYDDARCNTLCPHPQFLSHLAFLRKDRATRLAGKDLYVVAGPGRDGRLQPVSGNRRYRIQAIGWDGMVTLAGETIERSPFLLTPVPPLEST